MDSYSERDRIKLVNHANYARYRRRYEREARNQGRLWEDEDIVIWEQPPESYAPLLPYGYGGTVFMKNLNHSDHS